MSHAKQCPSTIGKQAVPDDSRPRDISAATGRAYWRSLDDLADTREFRDFLEREFPAHASELSDASRRHFLKVMGASLALAGAATIPGCRRPDHTIITYGQRPEDIIHGKALFYATAMHLPGGGAEGLLIETHDGRPTKVEGNPLHPVNQGKTSLRAQTAILEMYDPDRLREPTRLQDGERVTATWEDFDRFAAQHFERFNATNGRGLAILVDKKSSPSRDALRDRIQARWPLAMWLPYEPIENEQERIGLGAALGSPHRAQRSFENARRILSIADDFLGGESADLRDQRAYASSRRILETSGPGSEMSRLYVIEAQMSLTGGAADHRLRLKPSSVTIAGVAAMASVLRRVGGTSNVNLANAADAWIRRSTEAAAEGYTPPPREWLDAVVDDLATNPGAALITVGPSQPAIAHALAVAANRALGGEGATVAYTPVIGDAAASSVASIRALASAIDAGGVQTLVTIGCNPVFDAPADLDMASRFAKIATTITLAVDNTETGARSTWRLPGAHFLEAWGDATALDGSSSIVQPMIAPLFAGRSELEILARVSGQERTEGYEIVRDTWRTGTLAGDQDFEKAWRRVLHNGVHPGAAASRAAPTLRADAITEALNQPAPVPAGIEALFIACPKVRDGRHANNGWLQEIPDPVTKVTWDNPALVSPATARRLGLVDTQDGIGEQSAPVAVVTIGGRSIEVPIWRCPGVADDTIVLTLGYGREVCGHVGTGAGFHTYSLRTTQSLRTAAGVTVEPARGRGSYPIASAQNHHSMEGRSILREVDVQAWRAHGDEIDDSYDAYYNKRNVKFGERLGELSHVPVNRDVYRPDQIHEYTTRPQWGMSIDLATCIGCAACTAACQAENNIPVVGKTEVNKGREMHWIRVDRYYSGDADGDVDMALQPVTCMHCEAAPCETVCPVNATVHGPEGTNDMAYNRCIGTRYCSNNCPYKVRRFNFFDYATKKLHGEYVGKSVIGGVVDNAHLIPPRLREKIGEVEKLKFNPNVTVRERGVMEKCTYCIQRVNEARVDSRLQKHDNIPDAFFQVACEQACPTNAIVFGDILDPGSRVHKMREHARTYAMLGYLNVRPRTTYMVGLRNPNPAIREPRLDLFHGQDDEHQDDTGPAHSAAPPAPGEERRVRLPVLDAGAFVSASGGVR